VKLYVAPVKQQVASDQLDDAAATLREQLRALPLSEIIQPGMRIAVGVGSRGISCLAEIVSALIEELRAHDVEPFLVPAMGSHGGGTAEQQQAVLESYGLRPELLGAPILSSMETVQIGTTPDELGMPVYMGKNAAAADGIIVVNRIKPHTSFRAKWESGLMKMLAIGLGKKTGAETIHNHGIAEAMPAAGRVVIANKPVLFGVGIVENGFHNPAQIEVIPAKHIETREPELLQLANRYLTRIPAEMGEIDLMILREIGKNISGTGMDLNIVGMWRRNGGVVDPPIHVLTALDLTAESHGNATGMGYCDVIPQRLRDKFDPHATYTNCRTSHNWAGARIPITLPTDRDVIETGLAGRTPENVRLLLAQNTLELHTLWLSAPLLEQAAKIPSMEQIGDLRPLEFDAEGALIMPEAQA
jgi:hypothetical protein